MNVDRPIWEWSVPFLLLYFAPVFIGAYRRFQDKRASSPVWGLFLIVFLTGWSVIGWLWALRMAFKDKSLPDWLTKPVTQVSSGGGGSFSLGSPVFVEEPPAKSPCGSCSGTGSHYCTFCAGRGRWYDPSGQGFCQSCVSEGRIRCASCNGTGKVG